MFLLYTKVDMFDIPVFRVELTGLPLLQSHFFLYARGDLSDLLPY